MGTFVNVCARVYVKCVCAEFKKGSISTYLSLREVKVQDNLEANSSTLRSQF